MAWCLVKHRDNFTSTLQHWQLEYITGLHPNGLY